jgi:hypothetical protein
MEQAEMFLIFTKPLEKSNINYMATGSVASMLYGIPRFTHDLDMVIELPMHQISSIENAFPLSDFYCPPTEVLHVESRRPRRGHFNIIHHKSGFKADIYIHNADHLQEWGLSKKIRIELDSETGIWVAPPEYVIVRKLEFYREGNSEKHLHDIYGMLEVSGDIIDQSIIHNWITKLELKTQWEQVKIMLKQ